MNTPKITRPKFPKGYVDHPTSTVTWDWVAAQLTDSKHYWLCSVRSNAKPHVVPRWCVYMDGKIYYDGSPQTIHARNIEKNPHVSLHLESGVEAIILEGTAAPAGKPSSELGKKLEKAYSKYHEMGYAPKANSWNKGGLYVFTPRQCIAWSNFTENPTKFVF
jgi:nitroimidazol reductase NimA-like FMN-containing flavoprotein (pyridoxamine 5'-phosphate oxidase superfamily)